MKESSTFIIIKLVHFNEEDISFYQFITTKVYQFGLWMIDGNMTIHEVSKVFLRDSPWHTGGDVGLV